MKYEVKGQLAKLSSSDSTVIIETIPGLGNSWKLNAYAGVETHLFASGILRYELYLKVICADSWVLNFSFQKK